MARRALALVNSSARWRGACQFGRSAILAPALSVQEAQARRRRQARPCGAAPHLCSRAPRVFIGAGISAYHDGNRRRSTADQEGEHDNGWTQDDGTGEPAASLRDNGRRRQPAGRARHRSRASAAQGQVRAAARPALSSGRHDGQRRRAAAGSDQARPRQGRGHRDDAERPGPVLDAIAVGRGRLRHRRAAVAADALGEDPRHRQRGQGGRHRVERRHDALHHQSQRQDHRRLHREGPHRGADGAHIVQRHDAADGGGETVERPAPARPSDGRRSAIRMRSQRCRRATARRPSPRISPCSLSPTAA